MPLYEYRCGHCSARRDVILRLSELDSAKVDCPRCQQLMARAVTAAAVFGDFAPYECPITGDRIEGRRAHEENLAKHGCRVLEPGEKDQMLRRKAQEERQEDRAVEATVEQVIHEMPAPKRDRLIAEVQAGLNVQLTRKSVTN